MPLTNLAIKNLKPTNKTQKHFDGGGLFLQTFPHGGKCWRLKYRHLKKEKLLSFGVYPDKNTENTGTCARLVVASIGLCRHIN